jgi:hypothetical protein
MIMDQVSGKLNRKTQPYPTIWPRLLLPSACAGRVQFPPLVHTQLAACIEHSWLV